MPPRKIIISGTGRAGTTFLMRLLSVLGQPTGYDQHNWQRDYFKHSAAGMERDIRNPTSPYIVKNPELCVTLPGILARGEIAIDHAIIPMRNLDAAAHSRIRIGGSASELPGGLVGTSDPTQQATVLAARFHTLVETLVAHDIPHTFLVYPRFVQDVRYAYRKLSPIFPTIRRYEFEAAFAKVADPRLVHSYTETTSAAPEIASAFHAQVRRKKYWRCVRRASTWSIVLASVGLTASLALAGRRPPPVEEDRIGRTAIVTTSVHPLFGYRPHFWTMDLKQHPRGLGLRPYNAPNSARLPRANDMGPTQQSASNCIQTISNTTVTSLAGTFSP